MDPAPGEAETLPCTALSSAPVTGLRALLWGGWEVQGMEGRGLTF